MRCHVAGCFPSLASGDSTAPTLDCSHHLHSFLILEKIGAGFSTSGLISCKNMRELERSLLGTRLRPQQAAHQDADCSGRQAGRRLPCSWAGSLGCRPAPLPAPASEASLPLYLPIFRSQCLACGLEPSPSETPSLAVIPPFSSSSSPSF